jgi:aryl-alcohol dehydrogenase-like predicted oxidoreductase
LVYNIFSPKAAEELLPRAQKAGCAIVAREPLANGFLSGKYTDKSKFPSGDIRHDWPPQYVRARIKAAEGLRSALKLDSETLVQVALKFVLDSPAVSVVIPGIKTPEQAAENLKASDAPPLTDEATKLIQKLYSQNFGL